ncbi:MAG: tRNA-dihydrouridine synthase family protein [Candidatus Methylacidiphilales bacterium]|nr:tRNA-dihydrouridine synthase family protein [Candidatus Methylacidiphilales bacterium]
MSARLLPLFPPDRPVLVLAPMQDVTDLPFWRVMHRYGGPDIYFTEYFRVHSTSRLEPPIVDCIHANPAGRPVIAQMIGQDIPALVRTARELQQLPIAAIDLNLGCPAPIVCKKSSGGGMLRDLPHIDQVLGALREAITIPFTIKSRIGFHDESEFDALLEVYAKHAVDAVTIHGRTVKEMYRSHVHYDRIAQAVQRLPCPVFANGNILSARNARDVARSTGARGLMVGRGCIRNPWIWNQAREIFSPAGELTTRPTLRDLREYIEVLYRETLPPDFPEKLHVAKMKKYMHFIAQHTDPGNRFLYEIRRAVTEAEFFGICDTWLGNDTPFDPEAPGGALVNSGNPREDCH